MKLRKGTDLKMNGKNLKPEVKKVMASTIMKEVRTLDLLVQDRCNGTPPYKRPRVEFQFCTQTRRVVGCRILPEPDARSAPGDSDPNTGSVA